MSGAILIVGASGRAAAASAIRAGFTPFVIDLFADADTQRLAETLKCDDYPHGFVELAKRLPPMPWMYTGGLENYPDVVAAISETRELFGNGPDVLKQVRDPHFLRAFGSHFLQVYPGSAERWMRKPKRGSAGHGVRLATDEDVRDWHPDADYWLQEYREGVPGSAVFEGDRLLGVTRQLIGEPWLHASGYHYCGNITIPCAKLESPIVLRGIWGIDFIDDGTVWVTEVNPRYPASRELFSRESQTSEEAHSLVCDSRLNNLSRGKAIYYAPHRIVFPASGPWEESLANCTDVWRRPDFADIPHAGSVIEKGQPVFTLFAEADTPEACELALRQRAAEMDRLFAP